MSFDTSSFGNYRRSVVRIITDNSSKTNSELNSTLDVVGKIRAWRQRLIDMTHRNRLIYFDPESSSVAEITEPVASELFTGVVLSNKSYIFDTDSKKDVAESKPKPSRRVGHIKASIEGEELGKLLRRLVRNYNSYKQEQGLHTMFLAIGMVHWTEASHSKEEWLSPIVLLPVHIELDKSKGRYFLILAEEDVVVNPALRTKFETERGLQIQELPDTIDWGNVHNYLQELKRMVSHLGWTVDESVWLSRFHFEKFVMYKELEQHEVELSQHPILKAIAEPNDFPLPLSDRLISDPDTEIDPRKMFTVLDADSSQLEVLYRAVNGENLVVYGPPGTGKSQTIVNVISQLLMDGKRVLFVSEKMAALEVVYGKLRQLGLDFACMELHSHRSNKSKIIEELGRTIRGEYPSDGERRDDERFAELQKLRLMLDDYVNAVHNKATELVASPYEVIELLSKLEPGIYKKTGLTSIGVAKVTPDDLSNKLMSLRRLSVDVPLWRAFKNNVWRNTRLDIERLTLEGKRDLLDHISTLKKSCLDCLQLLLLVREELGLGIQPRLVSVKQLIRFLENLEAAPIFLERWFVKTENELNQLRADLVANDNKKKRYLENKSLLESHYRIELLNIHLDAITDRFKNKYRTNFRFLFRQYRQDKAKLRSLATGRKSLGYDTVIASLQAAIEVRDYSSFMAESTPYFQEELGMLYDRLDTNWNNVLNSLDWFMAIVWKNVLILSPDILMSLASSHSELIRTAGDFRSQLKRSYGAILTSLNGINGYAVAGKEVDIFRLETLDDLIHASDMAADTSLLDNYVQFCRLQNECNRAGLSEFLRRELEETSDPTGIDKVYEFSFYTEWLGYIIDSMPIFRDFNPIFHHQNISRFSELDRTLIRTYARVVEGKCRERQPKRHSSLAPGSEVSTLLREASKRRRQMPLRRLFERTSGLIQDLKPCILMSPLSVATYLPYSMSFDAIIFDEASQIKPEDAIGAVARGKSLIVVGDNKQLPPTTFFDSGVSDEGFEQDDESEILESILDECRASTSFREMYLKWHYRSRFEELIAFSNRYYYENRLVTFPNPLATGKSRAVSLLEVKNGIYDRGKTRVNRQEAIKVVDLIVEHVKSWGQTKSLGIVTFSIAQEEAVLDEIEQRLKIEPELNILDNSDVDEPFFVKSLEKVQGDERDYVIISVGYGKDANGLVSMNFGPLNRMGGERRLNVAITRARIKTIVVTSLSKADMKLDQGSMNNTGVSILKSYLDYARENGVFKEEYVSKGSTESPFEALVKAELQKRNFKVDSQVGVSGFRIDLAVKDPRSPDQYLLGIECDGASYHSSRAARDRDRLRQEVLERLGWNIYRIWSTDWFKHPKETVENLVVTINALIKEGKRNESATSMVEVGNMKVNVQTKRQALEEDNAINDTSRRVMNSHSKDTDNTLEMPNYNYSVHKKYARNWIGKRTPNDLFFATANRTALATLKSDILRVLEIESPITVDALTERISLIYSVGKARERAKTAIALAIKGLRSSNEISTAKDALVLYGSKSTNVKPRKPIDGEEPRPIQDVPLIELIAAVRLLCSIEYSMPVESLLEGVAKMIGFKRTGAMIVDRISKAIDIAASEGKIVRDQGVVSSKE